jgi:hypothetical protein
MLMEYGYRIDIDAVTLNNYSVPINEKILYEVEPNTSILCTSNGKTTPH